MAVNDNIYENASISHGDASNAENASNAVNAGNNIDTNDALSFDNASVGHGDINTPETTNINRSGNNNASASGKQNNISHPDQSAAGSNSSNLNMPDKGSAQNGTLKESNTAGHDPTNSMLHEDASIKGAQPSSDMAGSHGIAGTGGAGESAATETGASASAGATSAGGAAAGESAAGTAAGSAASGAASIGQTISGLASNAGAAIGHAATSFIQGAVTFIQGVAGAVVSAVGVTGAVVGTATVVGIGAVGGTALYASYQRKPIDELIIEEDECKVDDAEFLTTAVGSADNADTSAEKIANATKIYSVMKAYGWPDELIAGLLGCIECECGFDPTCIEYMESTERYTFGSQKAALFDKDANGHYNKLPTSAMSSHVEKTIAQLNRQGLSISESTYRNNGKPCVGIGLLQWTGSSAYDFLDYCTASNIDWYTIDIQMQYLISPDGYYRNKYCADPKSYTKFSVTDSTGHYAIDGCTDWCEYYITGHINQGDSKRRDAAKEWFLSITEGGKYGLLSYDESYGNSIVAAANATGSLAGVSAQIDAEEECGQANSTYVATDLAEVAMSCCWPTKALAGQYQQGTQEYQNVTAAVSSVSGRAPYPNACSDLTYVCIWFSGTDDEFSLPPCTDQIAYLDGKGNVSNGGRWEKIGTMATCMDQIQPGDLCICSHHTFLWLGEEIVNEKYESIWSMVKRPGEATDSVVSGSDSAMASWNSRSGGIQRSGYSGSSEYMVYRCVNPTGTETERYKQMHTYYDSLS